jgi:hypothetical protein
MATYGKISSSLLNFNATTTPIDNPFGYPSNTGPAIAQRNAPSLNLGLFQSTPYVLTPVYSPSSNPSNTNTNNFSFGNNITIVTPNTKPSQPNNVDPGLRVPRYGGSIMDKARGMRGSIIIGHDIATIGFAAGTSENSARGYGYPEGVYFNSPSVIVGSNILEGVGTADYGAGYGGGRFSSNVVMGVGFGSALVDGNLDYPQGGYGYGSIEAGINNTVMGNNNYAYSLRTTASGYSAFISNNTIVGQDNGVTDRFSAGEGYFVGNNSPVITARSENGTYSTLFRRNVNGNTILGNENLTLKFGWFGSNKMTNPYFSPEVIEGDNVIIGRDNNSSLQGYPLKNFDYDGSDISNKRIRFSGNTVIGRRNALMKEYFAAGYSQSTRNTIIGYRNSFSASGYKNIIVGDAWRWVQDNEHKVNTVKNIFIGELSRNGFEKFWGPQATGTPGGTTTTQNNTMIGTELEYDHVLAQRINHENVTVIGYQATTSSPTVNNEITLGNSSISALRCNVTSITSLSDARDKANIEPISNACAFIKDLKPVKFDWNRRDGVKAKEHDIGFLAQDLDEAQSKHGIQEHLDIVYKSNPEALEASYGKLLPILVQALKEQQEEIEKLKSTN